MVYQRYAIADERDLRVAVERLADRRLVRLCNMARADRETRTDNRIRRLKDHPVLSVIIVGGICVAAVATFVVKLDDLRKVFSRPSKFALEPKALGRSPEAPKRTENDRVFVACQIGVMPSTVPSEGRIHVLLTNEMPTSGGGLMDYFGQPGSEWKFTNDGLPAWAYRCELNNYSSDVLFNSSISVRLTFRVPLPIPGQENSRKQGDVTLDRDWAFTVPKLDPSPAAPYVFYVWNCCVPKFVQVRLPEQAIAEKGRKIPLIQSAGNLFEPLGPVPFK